MEIKKFSEFENINEELGFLASLWQDVKYGISKLGRYKAGGKIFGKGEVDKKSAEEMGEIMGDASNAAINAVYKLMKEKCPNWPNDRRRVTFLRGIIMYAQLYESIIAATEKEPNDPGYMHPEVANKLIENLRKVVKKALDVDLAAVYSVMDSNQDIELQEEERLFEELFYLHDETLNEEFIKKLGEWKDKAMDWMFGAKDKDSLPRKAGSRVSGRLQGAGDDETVDSERINTLESNKLPMVLMGVGAALGALGYIAGTEWFKNLVTETVYHPAQYGEKEYVTEVSKHFNADDRGWSYTLQNNGFMDATGKSLNFNQPVGNLEEAFKFYGNGDEQKGMELMSKFLGPDNQSGSVELLQQQLADPTNRTIGDVFNKLEGTWGDQFFMNQDGGASTVIGKMLFKTTKTVLIKAGFTTTTTTAIGGYLISIAPVLSALGITLVGAGALVKLMREKGQRQSRAATLNDLLQSLKLVEVKNPIVVTDQDDTDDTDESDEESSTRTTSGSIYPIMIKNLKALKSLLITYKGVNLEGELNTDKGLKIGKEYEYTNSKGEKKRVKLVSLTHDTSIGDDKKWLTGDDKNQDTLASNSASVIYPDKDGKYSNKSPQVAVDSDKLVPLKESIMRFDNFSSILEKEFSKGPRQSVVGKDEDYLTQAVNKVRKSVKTLIDKSDKGLGIDDKIIDDILSHEQVLREEPSKEEYKEAKQIIKDMYWQVYEHLYGKYSKTMSDFDPLVKEELNAGMTSITQETKIFGEKVARSAKRSMQFEGQGFYSGLGEFGEDLKEFNETLKKIMDYYKENPIKENRIFRFGDI